MKMKHYALLGGLSTLALLAAVDPARSATITNGSFENPIVGIGSLQQYFGGQNFGGWSVVGNDILLIPSSYSEGNISSSFIAQQGLNSIDLTGSFNSGVTNGVRQSIATNAGETYRLSFYVGVASGNGFYAAPSIADLSIDSGARISFTNSNLVPGTFNWQQFTYDFTATAASTTITFFNGTASSSNNFVGLDNVQISSTSVPEPFTIIGTIVGGTAALRLRKKLKSATSDSGVRN